MSGRVWIYFLGERNGTDIKIGKTRGQDVRVRLHGVNSEQTTDESYVLLAAVAGTGTDERAVHSAFRARTDKGRKREYFWPDFELVEYVNWLRTQWFVSPDGAELLDDMPLVESSHWVPGPGRRHPRPPEERDADRIFPEYDYRGTTLDGTAWAWLVETKASFQDYFTPQHIVNAAREAMGDIDLDAASHFLANRLHKIPDYFHVNRSAFDNDWHGRVWLNPPYKNNAPWFDRIVEMWEGRKIEQLCMLSPIWTFTTKIARPVVTLSTAMVLLSPTPKFEGNTAVSKRTGKPLQGTNHPHAILYIGDTPDRFTKAFAPHGIPLKAAFDEEFIPPEEDQGDDD